MPVLTQNSQQNEEVSNHNYPRFLKNIIMKRILLSLALIGTLFLTACEKDEIATPQTNDLTGVKEKTLDCSCGGGSWDVTNP